MSAAGYTLSDALDTARRRGPRWAPIIEEQRRTDVVELDAAASRLAAELAAHGILPGSRVALTVHNTAPHIAAMFGIWRAGCALVILNPRLTEGEVDALVTHAGASARLDVDAATGAGRVSPLRPSVSRDPDEDVAVIAYTSGTTGHPKGVVLTHANMLWAATAVIKTRRDSDEAVAAVVSPLCHNPIFVSHYLARLISGGTVILGAFAPERVVRLIAEHGVTDLPLVPAMIPPLLEARDLRGVERIAKVSVGSALTPMEVKRQLAERFPNAEILEAYGQTESTDGLTMTVGREALARPGTVGRPHAPFALAIRSAEGELVETGSAGEIVVRGPTVMRGYLDEPEATAAVLRDGWLHTGDLGRLDEDGFLYVTGRLKEVIISGGENVSPDEVEAVLSRHPAVIEVAVFGTPHARWGEQVTAAVVARSDLTADELREYARPYLAGFKLPRALVLVDALPKTSAGKVQRSALRERHTRDPDR